MFCLIVEPKNVTSISHKLTIFIAECLLWVGFDLDGKLIVVGCMPTLVHMREDTASRGYFCEEDTTQNFPLDHAHDIEYDVAECGKLPVSRIPYTLMREV